MLVNLNHIRLNAKNNKYFKNIISFSLNYLWDLDISTQAREAECFSQLNGQPSPELLIPSL